MIAGIYFNNITLILFAALFFVIVAVMIPYNMQYQGMCRRENFEAKPMSDQFNLQMSAGLDQQNRVQNQINQQPINYPANYPPNIPPPVNDQLFYQPTSVNDQQITNGQLPQPNGRPMMTNNPQISPYQATNNNTYDTTNGTNENIPQKTNTYVAVSPANNTYPNNVLNYYSNSYTPATNTNDNCSDALSQVSMQFTSNMVNTCANLVRELNKYPNDQSMAALRNTIVQQ